MLKRFSALAFVAFLAAVSASSLAQATESVTFQVDMAAYIQTAKFNPATDSVVIRGDFQQMAGDTGFYSDDNFVMVQSTTDDSVYTLTIVFPDSAVGKTIGYQFLPHHAGVSSWVEPGNRSYTITSAASQQIPMGWIANQYPGTIATVYITFEVNLHQIFAEGFNPAVDSVYVVGGTAPLNWGWAAGEVMTASFDDPQVFETTMQFTYIIGAEVDFKLFGAGADPFSNGGWESGSNHTMAFPSKDTSVLWVPELNVTKPTLVPDTAVFHVDMNKAYDGINYKPITGVKSVWITGSVKPLNWPPSGWPLADSSMGDSGTVVDTSAQLHRMYDDGTHGDSIAGDNKWSITLVFKPGVSSYVEYKYGAIFNGYDTLTVGSVVSAGSLIDNECASGVNHNVVLSGTSESIYNHWGDQDPSNPGTPTGVRTNPGSKPATYALSQNYPNPFNPTTQINYSVPKNSFVTLKVYNVLGQEVATLFSGSQKAGSYIASFDATRYASGVYFYRLDAGSFSSIKKMVLLK